MPLTAEQTKELENLPPEVKAQLIAQIKGELAKRESGESQEPRGAGFKRGLFGQTPRGEQRVGFGERIGAGLRAGVKALPSIIAGQVPTPEGQATGGIEEFIAKEKIKNKLAEERVQRLLSGQGDVEGAGAVGGGFRPSGFTSGGVSFERVKSDEEIRDDFRREAIAKAAIKTEVDKAEQKGKIELGQLVSLSNLETLAGVFHDLIQVYAEGVGEGGLGGKIQETISKAATGLGDLPGFLGGAEVGGKFAASGSFPGKREEAILKMMPMLTQQSTKSEGSVRIITGVLDRLGLTIPSGNTAPRTARRQLQESLRTFYRFARTSELLGQSFDDVFGNRSFTDVSNDELNNWIDRVDQLSSRIVIEDEELKSMERIFDVSLAPLDKILKEKDSGKTGATTRIGGQETTPTQADIDNARNRGAVGFDEDKGVFVDAQGNEI